MRLLTACRTTTINRSQPRRREGRRPRLQVESLETRLLPSAVLVADINPGPNSSNPNELTNVNGVLYFVADDGTHGSRVWFSAPATDQTAMAPGVASLANPANLTSFGGALYFIADGQSGTKDVHRTDASGTTTVVAGLASPSMFQGGGTLYILDPEGTGTTAQLNLWSSDGTASGTRILHTFPQGPSDPFINFPTVLGSNIYYVEQFRNGSFQLWSMDTSSGQTQMVTGLNGSTSELTPFQGKLYYFDLVDGVNSGLWSTDGTQAGTHPFLDKGGNTIKGPSALTVLNQTLVFANVDPTSHVESVWETDGTSADTIQIPLSTSECCAYDRSFVEVNGEIFFQLTDTVSSWNLWKTDGTTAGTSQVTSLSLESSKHYELVAAGNILYFTVGKDLPASSQLWSITVGVNGSTSTPQYDATIFPGGVPNPTDLTTVNGTLFFAAQDGVHGVELWKVAGVAQGTIQGAGVAVNGNEMTAFGNVPVAMFTRGNNSESAGDFTASINWKDGSTSAGVVSASVAGYTVTADHTYADEGTYVVSVVITAADGTNATVTSTATLCEELLPNGQEAATANQRLVSELYRDLLGRKVDLTGLAFWSGLLDSGVSRSQVVLDIEGSGEYLTRVVDNLYQQYLHRPADPTGEAIFVNDLQMGVTVEQVAAAMAGSPEYFQNRGGGTNTGFLDALYQDALGRAPDSTGRAIFLQDLAQGISRTAVAAAILASTEYRQDLVTSFYGQLLDRKPDSSGLTSWAGELQKGATDQMVIAGMIGDAGNEYFDKTAAC